MLCRAQSPATLSGGVFDAMGGPVIAAKLTLKSEDSRLYVSRSSEQGTFRFGSVAPGTYTLTLEQLGFCDAQVKAIKIAAGEMKALPRVTMAMPTDEKPCP